MKNPLKKVGLSLFSVLVALCVGELFVRFFTNFQYTAPGIFSESRIIPWELRPHVRTMDDGYWQEFHVQVKTNSLGYRDREFPLHKPAQTFRILVLGDSFTFGYGVEAEETYSKVLEQRLNENKTDTHLRYEVINAGYASGYAPDTEFTYFRHKGILLKPDLVLVGYFDGNDPGEEMHTQWPEVDPRGLPLKVTTDMYYIDTLGRLRTAGWLGLAGGQKGSIVPPVLSLKTLLRDHSQFLNFLIQRYRLFLITYCKRSINFDNMEEPRPQEIETAYQKIERSLTGLQMLTHQEGSRLAILNIPSKWDPNGRPPQASAFIRQWAQQHQVPLIDLGQDFEKKRFRSKDLYFSIDPHWNRQGHLRAGQTLYEQLQEILSR